MNVLLVLPLVIPLSAAALSLLVWRRLAVQRGLAVAATAGLLGTGLALVTACWRSGAVQVMYVGGWPARYGITLVADLFSAIMVTLAGLMGLSVVVYSLGSIDRPRESFGYFPLLQVLLMGVCGAFLTGDLFNLYVWFEVMLMASFVLLALGGERGQLRGGIVYVTLNLLASAVFLAGVGIVYGVAGTLNLADLAGKLEADAAQSGLVTALAMFFLVAFGIKAAVFPLFFWLPASYHTPPVAVSAIFAGLLTKVGVYALVRVFTLLFVQQPDYTHGLILAISALTMVTGVLGAAAQSEFRRILSFHIVSQIGYMIMGLALFGLAATAEVKSLALAASIFYIVHHIVVKTNLFLVSGVVHQLRGSFELKRLGGLYQDRPGLAVLFMIPALSLAGIPPLSGFFAKLALVQAGLAMEQYAIVAVALTVSLLTLYSMTKIWTEAFWKPAAAGGATGDESPRPPAQRRAAASLVLPIVALAGVTLAISLAVEPIFKLSLRAADQLVDREGYVRAVLGDR